MYKKLILIIIMSNLLIQCGFTPLYSTKEKDTNFSISEISFEGDKIINNYLKTNLSKYKNGIYEKNFSIKIFTTYNKKTLSKDKTANITDYELSVKTIFSISENNNFIKEITISEKKEMNNQTDKFEEQKYERVIKQNFASSMSNKLIIELLLISDN
tara:strand:- start:1412 stop:1882 length:471 start_codon:yes stop_codon:yes gene_type:complete